MALQAYSRDFLNLLGNKRNSRSKNAGKGIDVLNTIKKGRISVLRTHKADSNVKKEETNLGLRGQIIERNGQERH